MIRVLPGFFKFLLIKCQRRKKKEKLLKLKEPGLKGFENSQTFQIASNFKNKKWLLSREHIQTVATKTSPDMKPREWLYSYLIVSEKAIAVYLSYFWLDKRHTQDTSCLADPFNQTIVEWDPKNTVH